jgi:NHL repeat
VYVTDSGNNRIQKFDSNGNFITKWGTNGTGDGQFNAPLSTAIDSSGKVYVADFRNNRIQVFSIANGTSPNTTALAASNTINSNNTASPQEQQSVAANFSYENTTYGIRVQYPYDWIYKEGEIASVGSNNSAQLRTIVTLFPHTLLSPNTLKTNVAIVMIGTANLPPIFKAIHIDNMSAIAPYSFQITK